jgi:hypothetical protein
VIVVVCGALANRPANGGGAWTRLSWAIGLKRLGCDVYFVEQIAPANCVDASGATCDVERSVNRTYFRTVTEAFGLGASSALILEGRQRSSIGLSWNELLQLADAADLLVNISGHLTLAALKPRFRKRAFVDQDPGYTQFWHAEGLAEERLRDHHVYFTVGENIGHPDCEIPTGNIEWRPIRQPVVLDEWPDVNGAANPDTTPRPPNHRFTTVASWRGPYGRVTHNGVQYGLKAHEFRKFAALPTRTAERFEIALDVHPADRQDVDLLRQHGWTIADPKSVAADPFAFRDYVRCSSAEFSAAQGIYVETRSGWFSDRSARYLASGKPVLVQDTGFARHFPVGVGLVPFRTLDEAARGAETIASDYHRHSRAARAIAAEFFDSDKLLSSMLQSVGLK